MTICGLSGSLLSHEALARAAPAPPGADPEAGEPALAGRRVVRRWHLSVRDRLGPSSGARAVFDLVAAPLAGHLGFHVVSAASPRAAEHATLDVDGRQAAAMIALPWGQDLDGGWRGAVRHGIAHDLRWCYVVNGPSLRVVDAERAYSRRYAEFDLAATIDDEQAFAVFWRLLRAGPGPGGQPALALAVAACDRHRTEVRASLERGVREALGHLSRAFAAAARGRPERGLALDESLIVVYRILFLLFAEARGLVPRWHPVYRDAYTIESLRAPIERSTRPCGVWESLQAIARLAHRGCTAGALQVTPFNGRLFSPAHAPLADRAALDDGAVRNALLAVTTRQGRDRRERISYADLGVEQLGGVYENLLDYEPGTGPSGRGPAPAARSGRRKATGSFYTPRSLTDYVVRRTLAPLADDAAPDRILALKVLDPSMGSGAFLVAACRYLADRYEQALVREGALAAGDVEDADRAGFRRAIAQRCLFGVDINPMAVQLGRLSLWLATLAGDRPLTFLDHNLRAGNSLAGAAIEDVSRQPAPGGGARIGRPLPLFEAGELPGALAAAVGPRVSIATEPGDTLEQVRRKEAALARLDDEGSPMRRWRAAADLWCAAWFAAGQRRAPRGEFASLLDTVLGRAGPLPTHLAAPMLEEARRTAARERFFHWTLEFPEVFTDASGAPLPDPGFDAVIGNPPWEVLRHDGSPSDSRASLVAFARGSGIYRLQGAGHANLYQLFLERALSLVRRGGRLGMVLPSGFATDHGCGALRGYVMDRTTVDTLVAIENRGAIFPIHRGLKFLLLGLTAGGSTAAVPLRAGVRSAEALDRLPDRGTDPDAVPLSRALLERASGPQLAIPEVRSRIDLEILGRAAFTVPALADENGWHVHFGRELNATDDRPHFHDGPDGLPVIEGKLMAPFTVNTAGARYRVAARAASRLLGAGGGHTRARLAYRDVAAATNRLTLIAAILPAGVVSTHTVFCLREPLDEGAQQFLCGMFNSFVANYLVRTRVGTHVTTAIVERLPVPAPPRDDPVFREIAAASRRLAHRQDGAARARLQALSAGLYGLTEEAFAHVLGTFPLVDEGERAAALAAFRCIVGERSGAIHSPPGPRSG